MIEESPLQKQNILLADLPVNEWNWLEERLKKITLTVGATLYNFRERIDYAYFPLNGSVSLLTEFSDGFSVQTAEIGNEGMVGIPLVLGETSSLVVVKVLVPGTALRIAADALVAQLDQLPTLGRRFLRQVGTQVACTMQLAACNAHHHLDARLARCLLDMRDRTKGQAIMATHEGFAALLCAHRPSVSISMKRLERRGLISQRMGSLLVTEHEGLERASCECYSVMRALRNASRPQSF